MTFLKILKQAIKHDPKCYSLKLTSSQNSLVHMSCLKDLKFFLVWLIQVYSDKEIPKLNTDAIISENEPKGIADLLD